MSDVVMRCLGVFLASASLVSAQAQVAISEFTSGNATTLAAQDEFVKDTRFSHDRGFYDAPFELTITTETPGATIRYSTNGLPPLQTSGLLYTGPVRISGTTVLRVRAFKSGLQPSNTDTQTYLFLDDVIRQSPTGAPPPGWPAAWGGNTRDYGMDPGVVDHPLYRGRIKDDLKSIPSVSIVMDLKDLFDPATGIYANAGQDGRAWERPSSVELIHPSGAKGFQIEAGIRIRGGFSRSSSNPKHAFRLFFRREYGDAKLKYPLFGDHGTDTFDAIDLRTFQNYSWSFQNDARGIFLRDQFSRDTQLAMGHQAERGYFYHLYINGQYWGLYNTCERPEASYSATYYGGNSEDYDVIKVEAGPYTLNATDGDMSAWTRLYHLAKAGLASDAAYERIQGNNPDGARNPAYENLLDVPNLIDYMLVIIYGGNLDAPISNFLNNTSPNNWYGIRPRSGPFGFRFFVHDAEHTLLNVNENRTGPFPAGDSSVAKSSPQWLMKQLTANAEFRMLMADHIHRHFFNGGILTPEAATARFMARKNEIDRAVVAESARWGDAKRSTPFTRNLEWINAINTVLRNYFPARSQIVLNQLRADGLYPQLAAPSFNQHGGAIQRGFALTITAPAGTIYFTIDGSDPRVRGGGISPAARVYQRAVTFNESAQVKSRAINGGAWSALNAADFNVVQTFNDLLVTEIMYNPPDQEDVDGDEFEFLELKNVAPTTLDLSGVHFTNGLSFTFPNGSMLAPGQFAVLVSNPAQFKQKYPGVQIYGAYTGRLANGGETVSLVHAVGTPIVSVTYGDQFPWSSTADGAGFSLVPLDPNLNLNPLDPANWRASSQIGGSPGKDDPPASISTVWINEILTHTDPPEQDSIELHNPANTPADISYWLLTDQRSNPKKFQIPAGTIIPPGGYVVFTESQFNATPGSPGNFNLSSHGEEAYLFSANAAGNPTGFSDGFSFGASQNGVAFGRFITPSGEIDYPPQVAQTFGAPNSGPRIGPVVINEIQYHPVNGDVEYLELKNISAEAIPLFDPQHPANTWRINGISFSFPPNLIMPPGSLLLVTATEPGSFRSHHNVPASVPVLGPFTGTLQDDGELLQLQRPDAPDIDPNGLLIVPFIDVDAVQYNDNLPWPANASGGGPALERITAAAYGNDPANWRAISGPSSAGYENSANRPPQISVGLDLAIQTIYFPLTTNLVGSVTDDGLPNPPGQLTLQWEQAAGPVPATFSAPAQPMTTVTFPMPGIYTLRLTARDGEFIAARDISVKVEYVPTPSVIIPKGAAWKYLDNGSNQGAAWRAVDFDDSTWRSGRAELGYGDGDEATVVSFGPNAGAKYRTTYFRRAFNLLYPASVSGLTMNILRDDGCVVYLNATEIFRSNMPEGAITSSTFASSPTREETIFFERTVDPSLLVSGKNVLAIEVHQANATSSDLSFNLELTAFSEPKDNYTIWREQYFAPVELANPAISSDHADPDGDGHSNLNEFTSGTDPRKRESVFKLSQFELFGGSMRLQFHAVAGKSYTVQFTESFHPAPIWRTLTQVPVQNTSRVVAVTDPTVGSTSHRFYRIVLTPP